MINAGYYFYRRYYDPIKFKAAEGGKTDVIFEPDNRALFDNPLDKREKPKSGPGENKFELKTIYPGLLIGSGYNHEVGSNDKNKDKDKDKDKELKLGFFFDHTSGFPCIPGSSVKGILRAACELDDGKYMFSLFSEIAKDNKKPDVSAEASEMTKLNDSVIKEIFHLKNDESQNGKKIPSAFIMNVFGGKDQAGKYIPMKDRDIFFDSFPVKSENPKNKYLANDYITPHYPNLLKNPVPIQFLKVLPEVVFEFVFKLNESCFSVDRNDIKISAKLKLELFRRILIDLGAGAKRNVGYGNFVEYEEH